ncbi:MAG TPA: phospholipase C, phosphocholine-specific [Polyangiaceae bacterium]|nr:phospholipase C, phosphocholine-specific [Polyangiaceae bacterium]
MRPKLTRHTRRRFLGSFAQGAALSGVGSALETLARAAPAASSLSGVEHVVIFMQENRSFDHYLGTLSGVRGYGDRRALGRRGGGNVFGQPSGNQLVYPYRLDNSSTSGQCVGDVAHDFETSVEATNGGRLDAWIAAKGTSTMSYHTRADIPYLYALADAFTLCDHYFCSVNGPTNPNRLYLMSGTIDAAGLAGGPVTDNGEPPITWTTYPERLQKAGVSWRIYQETDNFDDNALAWFQQFQSLDQSSPLYQNGMLRLPRDQFAQDVMAGKLPAVSWVIAPTALCEHADHLPNEGINYGALHFLNALAANPSVWQKTIFIWNYDENGGFFDHVPPPSPPPGTPDEFVNGSAIGLGPRVPCLVISPWSRGGQVCSEVFDHTSVLRLLELWTGVRETNISAWRRQVCGDLTSALDFSQLMVAFPKLPDSQAAADAAVASCEQHPQAAPNGETAPPAQEPGARPLRALPYQLSAGLRVVAAESQLEVSVRNDGTGGCAAQLFHISATDVAPVHLALDAGARQTRRLLVPSSKAYALELRGPNGFVRVWRGELGTLDAEVAATLDTTNRTLTLVIENGADTPFDVDITSALSALEASEQTVSVEPHASASVTLTTSSGWYDYVLVSAAGGSWRRELAGHIEGEPSETLPS